MIACLSIWLSLAALAVVWVTTALAVGTDRGSTAPLVPRRGTRDLLRIGPVRAVLRWRPCRTLLQALCALLFLLIIVTGLFGRQQGGTNLATVLTWTYWWILLVLCAMLLGKAWCYVCPWDALAGWLARLSWWGPPRWPLSVGRPWPRALRNLYPAVTLFLVLTWLELGYGVTTRPALTACLGLLMFFLAFVPALLFERSAFCRYACLVGRISGLYALFAPLELRARDQTVCRTCPTRDCYVGSPRGLPCPTFQYLGGMTKNTYCLLCGECLFTCTRDNVALNVRPFASDLVKPAPIRSDEAAMVLVMLSMSTFHGITMTPAWQRVVAAVERGAAVPFLAAFSGAMAGFLVALGAAYLAAAVVSRHLTPRRRGSVKLVAIRYAYAFLPVTLFYHLAHNTMHFVTEAGTLVPVLSDPFGWGWNLLGTAQLAPGPLLPPSATGFVMVAFVVIGHWWSLELVRYTARQGLADPRDSRASRLPFLILLGLYSTLNLWTLAQPMDMRTGL